MITSGTISIIKVIIEVLKNRYTPISADELSFKTRASQNLVLNLLKELEEANVVIEKDNSYTLNRVESEYKLESLLK